ncbi:zeatin O-glucosyltransferase-like [Lotus japonicus]|uniref:zeatin O-glucosyltransferase-like n=1 Tax=Lotus japonicus TaxID=34305 RepID=UPI0025845637|nr:zeatin O-glucosyltransferase-like [Lotus japonicus]
MESSNYKTDGKNHSSSNNTIDQPEVVVVMVPYPAQSHLNQLLHLSRLILSHSNNNIPIHYVGTATHNRQVTLRVQGWELSSISSTIHFHDFKVPHFASPPPKPNTGETKFPDHAVPCIEASSHLREPLAELVISLSSVAKRVIVIHDFLMGSVVQDGKKIPNVESYTFLSNCSFPFFTFWENMGKPPLVNSSNIPEVPSLEGCFNTQFLDFFTEQSEFIEFSEGYIYNTARAIEGCYMEFMESLIGSKKKQWALGPFHPLTIKNSNSKGRHFTMEWLDRQEPKSVIYVSFGSTTTFTEEQIEEMAKGLEQSKQKFIWVLRDADKCDIFDETEVRKHDLENGFEKRTEGVGLVVRDWAPQLEILDHPSTGGFMSHCGWNSLFESISMGVPIAAWPIHSDQPRNTVLITEELKVGLAVRDWAKRDDLVTASVIANAVRRLMETKEGDEMREKAMSLKEAIHRSMDEGGVSHEEMKSFIAHITR